MILDYTINVERAGGSSGGGGKTRVLRVVLHGVKAIEATCLANEEIFLAVKVFEIEIRVFGIKS